MRFFTRNNRISALLVALLYVFFATFGAVAHTHAIVDRGPKGQTTVAIGAHHSVSTPTHCLDAGQRDCAACEWQALSVTRVTTAQPSVESALLRILPAVPVFAFDAVSIARSSSRAPPTA